MFAPDASRSLHFDIYSEKFRTLNKMKWPGQGSDFFGCFLSLFAALDVQAPFHQVRENLPYGREDFKLVDLLNVMAHVGWIGKQLEGKGSDIDPRLLPCLMVEKTEEGEERPAVVLCKNSNSQSYKVYRGPEKKTVDVCRRNLQGDFYVFQAENRMDSLNTEGKQSDGHSWFYALLDRFRPVFYQIFFASFVLNLISLSSPLFIMLVYDKVISGRSVSSLPYLTIGVFLAIFVEWILRNSRSQTLSWFSARMDFLVGSKIFGHLLGLAPSYTEKASVASQIARIRSFDSVREFFTSPVFVTLLELPFVLVLLGAVGLVAGPLVLIPILLAISYVTLFFYMRPLVQRSTRESARAATQRQQLFIEVIEKVAALRNSAVTRAMFKQFRDVSGKASYHRFRSMFLSSIVDTVSHMIYMIAGLATMVFGVQAVWDGRLTPGQLILVMTLVWRALSPIRILCSALPKFEQLTATFDQINRLMDIETEFAREDKTNLIGKMKGTVQFHKVGLKYTKEAEPVVVGMNLEVKKGQLVTIVGGSGTGKSTILKLAMGLYTPQMGSVFIDGQDIRQIAPIHLRKSLAYVPQEVQFFSGTLAENFRNADPFASHQDMKLALMRAGAWEEIDQMPDGLETRIIDFKSQISSSLSFKLSLARAYIKNSRIMLFDELPYSFLNSKAGDEFRSSLEKWKGARTIFLVTHREDYLEIADHVVVLSKEGRPFWGTREEFLKYRESQHHRPVEEAA